MNKYQTERRVWPDREAKGLVLEDLMETVLKDAGLNYRRNRVNGQGPDFYTSFWTKRLVIENKHWSDRPYGLSCIKSQVVSRFKRIRRYRRIVIASHLNFRSKESDKIEKALIKAKIKIVKLGFEVVDRETWRRAYRIIRRLIIRLLALKRFLHEPEVALACSTVIAEPSYDAVLPGDDVKWLD